MSALTITVRSEGSVVPDTHALLSVDVRHEVNRLSAAVLLYADGDAAQRVFPLGDSTLFDIGKTVEVRARYEGERGGDQLLFKGPVVRQAIEAGGDGPVLRVEMRHPAIAMTRARRSRVFNKTTDSDAWSTLCREAGLQVEVESCPPPIEDLVQYDCTDWDFLLSRADGRGMVVVCDDARLKVRTPLGRGQQPALKLEYGIAELYELEFECDASGQASGFKGRSWSSKDQRMVESAAAAPPAPGQGTLTSARAASGLKLGEQMLRLPAGLETDEVKDWAGSLAGRTALSLVRGRVALPGQGALRLLDLVEVAGVPERFAGRALVTGLCHRLDRGGWTTDLQFGLPPQPFHTRPDIAPPAAGGLLPPARGLQIGLVTKVHEDPLGEHRVQVSLPALGDQATPLWARLAVPEAGQDRGFRFLPEPGDEVLLGFLDDDPRAPVVLGSLYSSRHAPNAKVTDSGSENKLRGIVSRSGLVIGLLDEGDKPKLFLETPGGQRLTLDDDGQCVRLEDQHKNLLRLDKDGVTVESCKHLVVKAQGDLKLEASGSVTIKGSKVELQ